MESFINSQGERHVHVFPSQQMLPPVEPQFMASTEPSSPAEPPRRLAAELAPMRVEVQPSLAEPHSRKRRRSAWRTVKSVRRRSLPADGGTLPRKLAAAESPAFVGPLWNLCHYWLEPEPTHFRRVVPEWAREQRPGRQTEPSFPARLGRTHRDADRGADRRHIPLASRSSSSHHSYRRHSQNSSSRHQSPCCTHRIRNRHHSSRSSGRGSACATR